MNDNTEDRRGIFIHESGIAGQDSDGILVKHFTTFELLYGGYCMRNSKRTVFLVLGILLFLNGLLNIVDDSRILTYDITSILSGIGFLLLGYFESKKV